MFEDSVDEVVQKRSHHLTQEQSSRGLGCEVTGCLLRNGIDKCRVALRSVQQRLGDILEHFDLTNN